MLTANRRMKDEGNEDLRARTKRFALAIIRLYGKLPKTVEAQTTGKPMIRSGPSVGAHYREACRSRSNAEFISKMEGGLQELDETAYWLELLGEAEIVSEEDWKPLHDEAEELTAIFTSIVMKVKSRDQRQ